MAQWSETPVWIDPAEINKGKEYTENDGVIVDDINNIVNNLIYLKQNISGGESEGAGINGRLARYAVDENQVVDAGDFVNIINRFGSQQFADTETTVYYQFTLDDRLIIVTESYIYVLRISGNTYKLLNKYEYVTSDETSYSHRYCLASGENILIIGWIPSTYISGVALCRFDISSDSTITRIGSPWIISDAEDEYVNSNTINMFKTDDPRKIFIVVKDAMNYLECALIKVDDLGTYTVLSFAQYSHAPMSNHVSDGARRVSPNLFIYNRSAGGTSSTNHTFGIYVDTVSDKITIRLLTTHTCNKSTPDRTVSIDIDRGYFILKNNYTNVLNLCQASGATYVELGTLEDAYTTYAYYHKLNSNDYLLTVSVTSERISGVLAKLDVEGLRVPYKTVTTYVDKNLPVGISTSAKILVTGTDTISLVFGGSVGFFTGIFYDSVNEKFEYIDNSNEALGTFVTPYVSSAYPVGIAKTGGESFDIIDVYLPLD